MLLYAFGTLLFTLGLASALIVMTLDFAHYRHAMLAALRSLSLDGLPAPTVKPMPAPAQPAQARIIPTFPWALQPLGGAAGRAHS